MVTCGSYPRGSQNVGGTQINTMLHFQLRKFHVRQLRCCRPSRVISFLQQLSLVKRIHRLLATVLFGIGWKLTLNTYRHWLVSVGRHSVCLSLYSMVVHIHCVYIVDCMFAHTVFCHHGLCARYKYHTISNTIYY